MTQRSRQTFLGFLASTVFVALVFGTSTVRAQEICGLANVQYNQLHSDGFESVPAPARSAGASKRSSLQSKDAAKRIDDRPVQLGKAMGYGPKIAKGVAPTITIVTPADGASTPGRSFEARGTFTGPINTGVTVNGSPALTFGNQWVAMPLSPPSGAFQIIAVATTMDGMTANASRNITIGSAQPDIALVPKQIANIAPADMGFVFRSADGVVFGNVQVDFNGDNIDEYNGPASGIPPSFRYSTPGLYTARAKTLISGNLVTTERTVLVANVVTQRERACAVYGELRASLAANDLEASLLTFSTPKRQAMRPFFTALGSNRPVFATRLGTIANGVIGVEEAQLVTVRIESGEPIGSPLGIAADTDGVWRITTF